MRADFWLKESQNKKTDLPFKFKKMTVAELHLLVRPAGPQNK